MTVETAPAIPAVGPEPVTPIRPSEALRLGRLLVPTPITGTLYDGFGGACALGSMAFGGGVELDAKDDYGSIESRWPELKASTSWPDYPEHQGQIINIVWDLNDMGWNDNQIADWLIGLGL